MRDEDVNNRIILARMYVNERMNERACVYIYIDLSPRTSEVSTVKEISYIRPKEKVYIYIYIESRDGGEITLCIHARNEK